ncbi:MAG: hypothetical protein ACREXU_12375 [Gammaproteobacteria bacterium]
MRTLAAYLPGLVCAGGMLLCMRMMSRGSNKDKSCHGESQQAPSTEELAELHEEVTRLRAEVRLNSRQDDLQA